MEKITGYVHSLESFGSVDGPGSALCDFPFRLCHAAASFCHNPDTWE